MSEPQVGRPGFGRRLRDALDQYGPLCVGIDPHEALLRAWGMDATPAGAREFGLRTVEAAASREANHPDPHAATSAAPAAPAYGASSTDSTG